MKIYLPKLPLSNAIDFGYEYLTQPINEEPPFFTKKEMPFSYFKESALKVFVGTLESNIAAKLLYFDYNTKNVDFFKNPEFLPYPKSVDCYDATAETTAALDKIIDKILPKENPFFDKYFIIFENENFLFEECLNNAKFYSFLEFIGFSLDENCSYTNIDILFDESLDYLKGNPPCGLMA